MRKKLSFKNITLMLVFTLVFACGAMIVGNQGVSANTSILDISVTYDKGNGPDEDDVTDMPPNETWGIGDHVLTEEPTCTDSDYSFVGWKNGDQIYYVNDEIHPFTVDGNTTNLTFTAVWSVTVTYNVNLSDDDESIAAPVSGSAECNNDFPISDTYVLTADYYTFLGWATKADATTAEYAAGDTIDAEDVTAPITLYAVWKPKFYSVIYHANTDSDTNDSAVAVPVDETKYMDDNLTVTVMGKSNLASTNTNYATMTDATPTRSGYTFAGWATSATATTATYQPGATFAISSDTNLYAVWTASTSTTSTTSTTPQTGDSDHMMLYIVLAILCLIGIGYLYYDQRKAKVTK